MIRYQAVALAKFHNHFGAVDSYMKEFARICMETGNREVQQNLERLLNTEVVIQKPNNAQLLNDFKEIPIELDHHVLKQPGFNF